MFIENNYSVTQLFINKKIKVVVRETKDSATLFSFNMILKSVRELFENEQWNMTYHIISHKAYKKFFSKDSTLTSLEAMELILCDLGKYKQYSKIAEAMLQSLTEIIPNFDVDYQGHHLKIGNDIITEEIWEHIVYLLKLSSGDKVTPPLTFDSEEARKFYLAQQEAEDKINRIRNKGGKDKEALMKILLHITYEFPSFSIEYLLDQTMAQIQWLQQYAAGAVSYEVNAQAFAAGNVKKGKKLDFFIK